MSADEPSAGGAASRAPVPVIGREDLQARLAASPPPFLFEVLPLSFWRKHHLPGAVNAPPEQAVGIITARVPDKTAEIIVYCWDDT